MVLHKPNIVACILFVLFGISALLIVVAVMLQLDRPSLADTQAVASYSKHESRASADAEGRITKQKPSRSQEDSVADTTPTEPSASGTVEETLDLAKPERPVANHE